MEWKTDWKTFARVICMENLKEQRNKMWPPKPVNPKTKQKKNIIFFASVPCWAHPGYLTSSLVRR